MMILGWYYRYTDYCTDDTNSGFRDKNKLETVYEIAKH